MKRLLLPFLTLFFLLSAFQSAQAWGFWAHQRINRMAVFTLPPEMMMLYKKNIEYLTEHAIDPDKRRYAVDGEAPRHYIDIDSEVYGDDPFSYVPKKWNDAVEKLSKDTLMKYGIVPWHINASYTWLVGAFRDGNLESIMKISADIGHYIADGNVPLHTTENYNGQMTGQKGIHGLWESRLPEIFGENYDYFIGRAKYCDDVLGLAWQGVKEAHAALDSVLGFEKKLTKRFPSDRKFSFENRNNVLTKAYSKEFCDAYHNMLNGQVERRARASILRVGTIWYTAWVDAGQPDLEKLMEKELNSEKGKLSRKLEKEKLERKNLKNDREAGDIGMAPANTYELIYGECSGHHLHRGHVRIPAAESREESHASKSIWPLRAQDLGL